MSRDPWADALAYVFARPRNGNRRWPNRQLPLRSTNAPAPNPSDGWACPVADDNPDHLTRSGRQAAWRPWMSPTVTVDEARRSTRARAERDLQLAAWSGLSDDELEPFLARLRVFDERTIAWDLRQAREAAERERAR